MGWKILAMKMLIVNIKHGRKMWDVTNNTVKYANLRRMYFVDARKISCVMCD